MDIQYLKQHESSSILPNRVREGSFDSAEQEQQGRTDDARQERRQELAQMAKGLRRMKRQLLLQHVEDNHKPVDSLRDLLMKAAYGGGDSTSSMTMGSPPSSPRPHKHPVSSAPNSPSARME